AVDRITSDGRPGVVRSDEAHVARVAPHLEVRDLTLEVHGAADLALDDLTDRVLESGETVDAPAVGGLRRAAGVADAGVRERVDMAARQLGLVVHGEDEGADAGVIGVLDGGDRGGARACAANVAG